MGQARGAPGGGPEAGDQVKLFMMIVRDDDDLSTLDGHLPVNSVHVTAIDVDSLDDRFIQQRVKPAIAALQQAATDNGIDK